MGNKKTQEIPLVITELVSTPPEKVSGRRRIEDLDLKTTPNDSDYFIFQRGAHVFRMAKSDLISASDDYGSIYTPDGQSESPARDQVCMIAPALYTGFASNGVASGVTADAANSKLIIDVTGVYLITAQFSFGGTNSATFHFHPTIISDSPITELEGAKSVRKLGAGGDVGSASLTGLASLAAGDELGIMINSTADTKTIETWHAQFTIHRVG